MNTKLVTVLVCALVGSLVPLLPFAIAGSATVVLPNGPHR